MAKAHPHPIGIGDPGGVIVSTDAACCRAGRDVMRDGGNAFDAACAALLAQCVTSAGYVCAGGEVAALLYRTAQGTVESISGVGTAPGDPAAIDWYHATGQWGDGIRAAATPSIIGFCTTVLARYGTTSFEAAAAHASSLAGAGRPAHYRDAVRGRDIDGRFGDTPRSGETQSDPGDGNWAGDFAQTLGTLVDAEKRCPGSRERKLDAVRACFYEGEIAETLCAWYRDAGGFLSAFDLAMHRTEIEPPARTTIGGATIFKCGAWNQGPWLLHALQLLERVDIRAARREPGRYRHLVAEATKLAIADWRSHFGDPRFVDVPLRQFLSAAYLDRRAALIGEDAATGPLAGDPRNCLPLAPIPQPRPAPSAGTTTCIVRDRWGNLAVLSPSGCGSTAGSGGTGIIHGTRLAGFSRDANHPNRIDMHKRPLMTPSPTLVLDNGEPVLAFAATGGLRQDQAALQVVLEYLHADTPCPDLPLRDLCRDALFVHESSRKDDNRVLLELNARSAPDVRALKRRGHRCRSGDRDLDSIGSSMIWRSPGDAWHAYGPSVDG